MKRLRRIGRPRPLTILAALFVAAIAPTAMAVDSYVGAAYGWTAGNNEQLQDSTGSGWRAFLGFTEGGPIALEFGYADFSDFESRTQGSINLNAWDASLLFGAPLGPLTFFGRFGFVYGKAETANRGGSDWTYKYGLGADVALGKTFALRFEWNRSPIDTDIADVDVDTASVGLLFRF